MQDRFKQLLEKKNLTATRFAALINVNASAMSHILNGRSRPSSEFLEKIIQAFPDVNLNWLISGSGDMLLSSLRTEQKGQPRTDIEPEAEKSTDTPKPEENKIPVSPLPAPAAWPPPSTTKKIKRIILFFEDGSFEDYEKS